MSCPERSDVISAYVDGEASPEEVRELQRHLESCRACRERVTGLKSLKHGLSMLEARARPPEAVVARVQALRFRGPRTRLRRVWWLVAAVSAACLAVAGFAFWQAEKPSSLADELVADHLKYVPVEMPAEVASSEPERVRQFFEGKVPFDPLVPSLEGAELIGGRLCRIRGYYEQLLFYERNGRKLSLYVSNRPDATFDCAHARGHHICGQRQGGLNLRLVGDVPAEELRTLVRGAR